MRSTLAHSIIPVGGNQSILRTSEAAQKTQRTHGGNVFMILPWRPSGTLCTSAAPRLHALLWFLKTGHHALRDQKVSRSGGYDLSQSWPSPTSATIPSECLQTLRASVRVHGTWNVSAERTVARFPPMVSNRICYLGRAGEQSDIESIIQ